MTQRHLKPEMMLAGCGGSEILTRAGAGGLERLLAEKASRLVAEVHAGSGNRPTDQELLAMKKGLEEVLSDSGAQSLREVATDIVPLRCRGDPFELGKMTNLLEAASDCRDYVSNELSKRGVPHLENPRSYWSGC